MVKGRSTKVIGVRVPDPVAARIKNLADRRGLTVSEFCMDILREVTLPGGWVSRQKKNYRLR
jgi:predicted DNA binding CopG/RHH family protein